MAWLRLDDGFTKHPKFEGWRVTQKWAWLEVMEYCARYSTGGRIPKDLSILPRTTTPELLVLGVSSGWIDVHADGSMWVHDWHIYNPKDPTAAERQARRRAKLAPASHEDVTAADKRDSHGSDRDKSVTSRAGTRGTRPVPSPEDREPEPVVEGDSSSSSNDYGPEATIAVTGLSEVVRDF